MSDNNYVVKMKKPEIQKLVKGILESHYETSLREEEIIAEVKNIVRRYEDYIFMECNPAGLLDKKVWQAFLDSSGIL